MCLSLMIFTEVNSDADHTYLMFSATFPKSARRLAKEYMEEDFIKIKVFPKSLLHLSFTNA
jgi:ATP-dependent RNA helicase DDX3X